MSKSVKTFVLLAALSGVLLAIGAMPDSGPGSNTFLGLMLVVALGMSAVSYFHSDRIAVRMARAKPLDPVRHRDVVQIVERLAERTGQPVADLYLSPSPHLDAFATGRNPQHAAVVVNQGLCEALTPAELEGVLGHELQHVHNRDILVRWRSPARSASSRRPRTIPGGSVPAGPRPRPTRRCSTSSSWHPSVAGPP